ncbi:phosphate-starvation-inducible PsiE family protein [Nitrosococcus oceani]|uniref:phosphate-starvation-inducible PsiE family protein n=1 Tax=Nitrosococcus oceani TaxID=1229 RepID=UPI00056749B5
MVKTAGETGKILEEPREIMGDTRRYWSLMSFYERFEHAVALVLTGLIAAIILIALWRLMGSVWTLIVIQSRDPLDHAVFQTVFGNIMTLLIAMEFKHSILRVIERKERIIQVKTVLLIALLALARKFIILDISAISASLLAALALSSLALGSVYWLLQERDDRRGSF